METLGVQKRNNKLAVLIWAIIGKVAVVLNYTVVLYATVILIWKRKKIGILAEIFNCRCLISSI